MGEYKEHNSWLGIGSKTGGFLIAGGVESTFGPLFNVKNTAARVSFSLTSIRFGLGIGGGTGIVALCVFNCPHIGRLDNMMSTDWGVNLALGNRWDDIAKTLLNFRFFTAIAKIGIKMNLSPGHIDDIRNAFHYLYNANDIYKMDNAPTVIAIDTPIGVGAEVSVNWCVGRIHIDA